MGASNFNWSPVANYDTPRDLWIHLSFHWRRILLTLTHTISSLEAASRMDCRINNCFLTDQVIFVIVLISFSFFNCANSSVFCHKYHSRVKVAFECFHQFSTTWGSPGAAASTSPGVFFFFGRCVGSVSALEIYSKRKGQWRDSHHILFRIMQNILQCLCDLALDKN